MFFFFNDTATTEIYTLSLHDALPIWPAGAGADAIEGGPVGLVHAVAEHDQVAGDGRRADGRQLDQPRPLGPERSEEHTSELQSRQYLVCRLLLEKKNSTPPNCTQTIR